MAAGSGPRSPVKKDTVSSSATARRKPWDRASARLYSGSAWEAPHHSSSVWSCWSWGSSSWCPEVVAARDLHGHKGDDLVIYPPCATLENELIEVCQRFGEREAPLMICQGAAE